MRGKVSAFSRRSSLPEFALLSSIEMACKRSSASESRSALPARPTTTASSCISPSSTNYASRLEFCAWKARVTVWQPWKNWAAALKEDTYALYLASRDPRVPLVAKFIVVLVVTYALSPIDLIPDFIPVLGYLDDLLLLPMGIALAIRLMPRDVWEDCKDQARAELASELPRNRTAAIVIVMVWIGLLGLVAWLAWPG